MATFDDRHWLLSHIKNSYITSDDTGFCEMVLQGEMAPSVLCDLPGQLYPQSPSPSEHDDTQPHSLDVASDLDMFSRHRSYTAQHLERMKKEKKTSAKVKKIHCTPPTAMSEEELDEMFSKKVVVKPVPTKSLLSELLRQAPDEPRNPFLKYAKFDGITHNNVATQTITIFPLLEDRRPSTYPLRVCVVSTAKVLDLIGLTCWHYTKEKRHPPLKEGVERYSLHIAEEDGQVDWDFQVLPPNDTINKFGFKILALAENDNYSESTPRTVITVNMSGGVFSKIEVDNYDITLREILNRTVAKRREMAKIIDAGVDYHLERDDKPGVILSLDKTLLQVNCTEFAAVRDNCKRVWTESEQEAIFYSFKVVWVRTIKIDATIEITTEKIEIQACEQSSRSRHIYASQVQPVAHHVNRIVQCTRKNLEKKNKFEVSLIFKGEHSFKNYVFECDDETSKGLVDQCQKIITSLQESQKNLLVKKQHRKHSLSMRTRPRIGHISHEA